MLSARSLIIGARLIPVLMTAVGWDLHADDRSAASDGDKIVPVTIGGRTIPIRVKSQPNPLAHATFTDELDPNRVFSATNPLANKTFSPSSGSFSHPDSDFKSSDQKTFITKSYSDAELPPSAPNLHTKADVSTASAYIRSARGFDRSYHTSSADSGQNRTAVLSATDLSADQNRSAALDGPKKSDMIASTSMGNKQYLGPGAQHVPDDFAIKDNIILSRMSGLPNRPLSIDEVRNLINHETKPNTEASPEESSKPLNDPDYKPGPLRDNPSPDREDDKDDPVPPPGTMAAPPPPENADPLPQP